ncbi:MAG: hypothetical protein A2946_03625 [Candidatus Liptonbacteria bacterium RIFCSPLOWO2_01_FULL_53_13]|uniref:Uncharacterized protein n=1 Tax=Candidatus Liptonbacteria bacterium RIFCSPLOWO2_01_FULL_53_13 TaxID=1798651 RepID=A0A1G2CL93_9BACT|nr:MAG: hypothetical protein A2946_03625 [Candidatus Liptonbacteria bacterium RIFCSPLOWO2_01_FULL_53_13]
MFPMERLRGAVVRLAPELPILSPVQATITAMMTGFWDLRLVLTVMILTHATKRRIGIQFAR